MRAVLHPELVNAYIACTILLVVIDVIFFVWHRHSFPKLRVPLVTIALMIAALIIMAVSLAVMTYSDR